MLCHAALVTPLGARSNLSERRRHRIDPQRHHGYPIHVRRATPVAGEVEHAAIGRERGTVLVLRGVDGRRDVLERNPSVRRPAAEEQVVASEAEGVIRDDDDEPRTVWRDQHNGLCAFVVDLIRQLFGRAPSARDGGNAEQIGAAARPGPVAREVHVAVMRHGCVHVARRAVHRFGEQGRGRPARRSVPPSRG